MSSQKGNVKRTRTQKHQNRSAFKNDMHDTSQRTKRIKSLTPDGLCQRCKEVIEWKIKYKKYKPLKQPSTCVRCRGKTVKRAYYTVCQPCAETHEVCAKCNTKAEIVQQCGPSEQEKLQQDNEVQFEMQQLKERQRRSALRAIEKGETDLPHGAAGVGKDNLSDDGDSDHCDSGESVSDTEPCDYADKEGEASQTS